MTITSHQPDVGHSQQHPASSTEELWLQRIPLPPARRASVLLLQDAGKILNPKSPLKPLQPPKLPQKVGVWKRKVMGRGSPTTMTVDKPTFEDPRYAVGPEDCNE